MLKTRDDIVDRPSDCKGFEHTLVHSSILVIVYIKRHWIRGNTSSFEDVNAHKFIVVFVMIIFVFWLSSLNRFKVSVSIFIRLTSKCVHYVSKGLKNLLVLNILRHLCEIHSTIQDKFKLRVVERKHFWIDLAVELICLILISFMISIILIMFLVLQ